MQSHNLEIAEAYYLAMNSRDLVSMSRYLDEEVESISPLAHICGKEAVLEDAKKLMESVERIDIRAKMGSDGQAVLIYDLFFLKAKGVARTAALLNIENDKIIRSEVFTDSKIFKRH